MRKRGLLIGKKKVKDHKKRKEESKKEVPVKEVNVKQPRKPKKVKYRDKRGRLVK